MRKFFFHICTSACFILMAAGFANASEVELEGSVARGQESSMAYQLGAKQTFDPLYSGDSFDITPSLGISGHAWVPDHGDTVWGATVPLGLRFRMFTTAGFRPYLSGAIGPSFLSESWIDDRDLGSHVLIMTRGALGANFGDTLQHRIEGQYTHHSSWGIANTDPGYDTYGVSYGYSF